MKMIDFSLEFKRSEQQSTEAAAVLFVDDEDNELRSDTKIKVVDRMSPNKTVGNYYFCVEIRWIEKQYNIQVSKLIFLQVISPIRFVAQLVGSIELILEVIDLFA